MQTFRLDGQVHAITGAGSGIGTATAMLFAQAGARVVLIDIDAHATNTLAQRIGSAARAIAGASGDVRDEAAMQRAFDGIVATEGRLDGLVNSAGGARRGAASSARLEDWQAVLDLNLTGTFICARQAARLMRPRGGTIVNLASIMSFSGGIFPNASYQASKGGVLNLTRALALEWAPENIRVNAVAPTFVRTTLTRPIFEDPARLATVMQHTPLGRLPEAIDIARAILYLASPASNCVTGTTLPVDSGYLAL